MKTSRSCFRVLRVFLQLGLVVFTSPTIFAEIWASKQKKDTPIAGFPESAATDSLKSGDLIADPPTQSHLSYRWFIEGDKNRNATLEVKFRKAGGSEWMTAFPPLRVQNEVIRQHNNPQYRAGNLFAGTLFSLEPGTSYELKLVLTDPDGGSDERELSISTKPWPRLFPATRIILVDAEGKQLSLSDAVHTAKPGDHILMEPGVYRGHSYKLKQDNVAFIPKGEVILDGENVENLCFNVGGTQNIWFQDIIFRNWNGAVYTGETGPTDKNDRGAVGLVVKGCRFENVSRGVWTSALESTGWHIADNVFIGTEESWFPRPKNGTYNWGPAPAAVKLYGRGHVICHNRISKYIDGIAMHGRHPLGDDPKLHPVAYDIFRNDISETDDEAIETGGLAHNVRVYENRIRNTHGALSAHAAYGGPVYFIRNSCYAVQYHPLRWFSQSSGLYAYHNTTCTTGKALSFSEFQNGQVQNNLFLGSNDYCLSGSTLTSYTLFDYNGWFGKPDKGGTLFLWRDEKYPDLAAFTKATSHETHGMMVDYSVFRNAQAPKRDHTYQLMDYDLQLQDGSKPIDAGRVLPWINEDYTGAAPDLGAHELGKPVPHYGPRE
jgi:hypothetical protein